MKLLVFPLFYSIDLTMSVTTVCVPKMSVSGLSPSMAAFASSAGQDLLVHGLQRTSLPQVKRVRARAVEELSELSGAVRGE